MPSSIFTALLAVTGAALSLHCNAAVEVRAASLVQQEHLRHRRQQEQLVCSCSPRSYTFQFLLNEDCSSSAQSPDEAIGVSNANCQITDAGSSAARSADNQLTQILSAWPKTTTLTADRQSLPQASNTTVSYISSVLFIEFDTSGTLALINENGTYLVDANFTGGMTVSYPSISQLLNPSLGLEDQMQFVPGGAGLFMFGSNNEGEVILSSRVVWEYTGACDVTVDIQGKTLGWVSIEETEPAQSEFCNVSESSPPTMMVTITPTIMATTAPTLAQTTKGPTVLSNVIVVDIPPVSPPIFSQTSQKSSKSKAAKVFKSSGKTKTNEPTIMKSKSPKKNKKYAGEKGSTTSTLPPSKNVRLENGTVTSGHKHIGNGFRMFHARKYNPQELW